MVRDDLGRQHIALSVAAGIVYEQTGSKSFTSDDVAGLSHALNQAAHALANVVSIYVMDGKGQPRTLTAAELMTGQFTRGATRFSVDGRSFSAISVTRRDMRDALVILKKAGLRLR